MDWFFDGLGTQIISKVITFIIGVFGGGLIGYKVGIYKNSGKQKQKAKDDAKQNQKFAFDSISIDSNNENFRKNKTSLNQKQYAGNNAEQIQIGDSKHE